MRFVLWGELVGHRPGVCNCGASWLSFRSSLWATLSVSISQRPESCPPPAGSSCCQRRHRASGGWCHHTASTLYCPYMRVINKEGGVVFSNRYNFPLKASISPGRGLLISYFSVETDTNVLFPCYLYSLIHIDLNIILVVYFIGLNYSSVYTKQSTAMGFWSMHVALHERSWTRQFTDRAQFGHLPLRTLRPGADEECWHSSIKPGREREPWEASQRVGRGVVPVLAGWAEGSLAGWCRVSLRWAPWEALSRRARSLRYLGLLLPSKSFAASFVDKPG